MQSVCLSPNLQINHTQTSLIRTLTHNRRVQRFELQQTPAFTLFCSVIRSFVAQFQSHPHAVAFHPAYARARTHARACTRTYARARDIYADAASNDFTLPSSNRAALPLSFSIIGPPGVTQTPPVRQNPLSDPKV